MPSESLRNQFLIAMPSLADSNFERSVSLLCEHGDDGALGLVINRPTDLDVASMLDHLEIDCSGLSEADSKQAIYWGGPVQTDRGFVLHSPLGDWESTIQLSSHLGVSTSRDILTSIGAGAGPEKFLITLGYAGWEHGQLEQEILQNSWLNITADQSVIFETDSGQRWEAATRLLGIDPSSISTGVGHA
ncbi:MAG: YqgE/AlgH family protein [Oceanococcus sp.]